MTPAPEFEPSGHNAQPNHSKGFSLSKAFRISRNTAEVKKTKMTVSQVKLQLELAAQDLMGNEADRLRFKIRGCREVQDLWMLRSDLYQIVAKKHNQQEAAQRVNQLLPCFEGWIPSKNLTPI